MVCIANYTELNLIFAITLKNDEFVAKKVSMCFDKKIYCHFCTCRKAANLCRPVLFQSQLHYNLFWRSESAPEKYAAFCVLQKLLQKTAFSLINSLH